MSDWDQRRRDQRRSRSRSPPNRRFDRPPSRDRAEWTRGGRGGGRSPSPPPRGRWDDRGRDRSRDRSWDRGAPAYGGDGDRFPQRRSPVRYERDWVDRDRDDRGYQTQQQPRGYDEGYPQRQQQRGGYDRPRSEEGNNRGENFHRGGGDGAGGGQWDNAAGTQRVNHDQNRNQGWQQQGRDDDRDRPPRVDRSQWVKKSDWNCPRGCGVVFGSKSNCYKCGAPRESDESAEVPAQTTALIHGALVSGRYDWVCNVAGCISVNFARRTTCFTCAVPKGVHATNADQTDPSGLPKFDPALARQALDATAAAAWGASVHGTQPVNAEVNAAWMPKEFNETAGQPTEPAPQPAQPKDASKKKRRKEAALPGAIEDAAGGEAAVAALEQSGYVYDPDTGYYKDEKSGMWYDPNSGLSYHAESAAWYKWNTETNAYEPAAGQAPAVATANAQQQQQQPQSAAKKPRVTATIGSSAKLDVVAIKKHQVAKLASAELEKVESAYRDRAAERRTMHGETTIAGGAVKGKVYGGKIRTPGVPGYAPGSTPQSDSKAEGEDSYKASVQRVALERFQAAMKE